MMLGIGARSAGRLARLSSKDLFLSLKGDLLVAATLLGICMQAGNESWRPKSVLTHKLGHTVGNLHHIFSVHVCMFYITRIPIDLAYKVCKRSCGISAINSISF